MGDDEAVLFADAVHPTHAARPVGCWAPEQEKLAIEQTSGRQRINVHGAIDLETGRTRMIEVETVDAVSTIRLLESIEAFYPMLALIHVFLDNARYHHAKLVQDWLSRPDCRIRLHFIPAYCPHLNPIERLWGVMHKHVTHNKCYATCSQFADATLGFLRETVPRNWANLCDSVSLRALLPAGAAQRLAVDRDDFLGRAGQRCHPVNETAPEKQPFPRSPRCPTPLAPPQSSAFESEDHDKFSTLPFCHELLHPIALRNTCLLLAYRRLLP